MSDTNHIPQIKIGPTLRLRNVYAIAKTAPTPVPVPVPEVKPSTDPKPPNKRARELEGQDREIRAEGLISNSEPHTLQLQAVQNQLQGTGVEEKKPSKWIHFGPTYKEDTEINRKAKESAWLHIFDKNHGNINDYMRDIEKIGKEAMDCYHASVVDEANGVTDEFVELMAKDGCFFLQLAVHILGAGAFLGYPPSNPYFGTESNSSSYIPAMFYIGNQIPYVVINALKKQSFFKNAITRVKLHYPKRSEAAFLAKLALYEMLMEPLTSTNVADQPSPSSNVLEALRNQHLGSKTKIPSSPMRELQDPEIGIEDGETKFPNVEELEKLGIRLRKAKSGVTNIQFTNYFFRAYLDIPPLTVDGLTKHLLMSLMDFEQLVSESDRGVTAYIRFINDLAPTYKGIVILRKKEIIHAEKELKSSDMTHMLGNLIASTKTNFTPNLRLIRRKIEYHRQPPWGIIGGIIGFFTIVQTVLALVAYIKPRT